MSNLLQFYEQWLAELEARGVDERMERWAERKNAREAERYPLLAATGNLGEPAKGDDMFQSLLASVRGMVALQRRFRDDVLRLKAKVQAHVNAETWAKLEAEATRRYWLDDDAYGVEHWHEVLCRVAPEEGYAECPHARDDSHKKVIAPYHDRCPVCGLEMDPALRHPTLANQHPSFCTPEVLRLIERGKRFRATEAIV